MGWAVVFIGAILVYIRILNHFSFLQFIWATSEWDSAAVPFIAATKSTLITVQTVLKIKGAAVLARAP